MTETFKDTMKNAFERLDLVTLVGLGRRKRGDNRFATFNRRMLAATVDSVIVALLVAPLVDTLFTYFYGPVPIDAMALQEQMRMQPNDQAAGALFWHTVIDSGAVTRWAVNSAVQLAAMFALTAMCWQRWSATPGKILLRIKIVDAQTFQPMTSQQIALRLFGYIPSTLCLFMGFFWIGIDKQRRAWHDKIAGTSVIVLRKTPKEETP